MLLLIGVGIILIHLSINKEGNWYQFANTIGTTLLATSIVSIVFEYSSIKSTVNIAIQNKLRGDVNLDSFSDDSLKRFGKRVAVCQKLEIKEEELEKSIYSLESQLLGLLDNTYYEYYNSKVYLKPNRERKIMHKRVKLNYLIVI